MSAFAVAFLGVTPSVGLPWWFCTRDRHREPLGAILKTFLLGVLVTVPTVIVALAGAPSLAGVESP